MQHDDDAWVELVCGWPDEPGNFNARTTPVRTDDLSLADAPAAADYVTMPSSLDVTSPFPNLPMPEGYTYEPDPNQQLYEHNPNQLEELVDYADDLSSMSVCRRGHLKIRQPTVKYTLCCSQEPWKIGCAAFGEDIKNLGSAGPDRNSYLCRACGSKWSQIHPAKLNEGDDPRVGISKRRVDASQPPRSGGYKCTICKLPKNPAFAPDGIVCKGCKTGGVKRSKEARHEQPDLPDLPAMPSLAPLRPVSAVVVAQPAVPKQQPVLARMVGGGPSKDLDQKHAIDEAASVSARAASMLEQMSKDKDLMSRVSDIARQDMSDRRVAPQGRVQLSETDRGIMLGLPASRQVIGGKPIQSSTARFRISGLADPDAKYLAEVDACDWTEALENRSCVMAAATHDAPEQTATRSANEPTEADADDARCADLPEADAAATTMEEETVEPTQPRKRHKSCDECKGDCTFVVQCTHGKCRRGACSARCAGFRNERDMNRLGGYKCSAHTKEKTTTFCVNCDAMISDRHGQTWNCVGCEDCDESIAWWCYSCAKVTQKIMNNVPEWRCPAHRK